MKTIQIASLAALALAAFANVASAGPSDYYPISNCVGTDETGKVSGDVRFRYGVAENYHDSKPRYLVCPVPFDPSESGKVIVRVVGFDNNNGNTGKLRAKLCEVFLNASTSCSTEQSSGQSFIGTTTLEVSRNVNSTTRFLYLNYTVPDVDTQSGRSFGIGYRVCRSSC
jgi:hypothetical protein